MPSLLVVDDDPVSRYLLRKMLEQPGYTVFEAADGTSATKLYKEGRHDLVLLDILMPDKDGFETLFDLRRINPQARIVMMTAGGRMTVALYEQLARSLRIPHLLTKPFETDTVWQAVNAMLATQKTDGTPPILATARQKEIAL